MRAKTSQELRESDTGRQPENSYARAMPKTLFQKSMRMTHSSMGLARGLKKGGQQTIFLNRMNQQKRNSLKDQNDAAKEAAREEQLRDVVCKGMG